MQAVQDEDGNYNAKLNLKLERSVAPLPVDSTVIIRARSALGLKYLEINRGTSTEGFPEGATVPLANATPEPVDLDEVLNTFDEPTRKAAQQNLREFGTALAGRGSSINDSIGNLKQLTKDLPGVMGTLASDQTQLGRFVRAIAASAAEAGPVGEQQADAFVGLDTTFGALASVARPYIQETIEEGPPTEDTAIATMPRIRPLLKQTATTFRLLRPGMKSLRKAGPSLAGAVLEGIPAFRGAPALNARLVTLSQQTYDFSEPVGGPNRVGIESLVGATDPLESLITYAGPAQSVCNYGTLLFRNLANLASTGDARGSLLRFIAISAPDKGLGTNNMGTPAANFAAGPGEVQNYLHWNPYPNTAAPGQSPRECEAGNEPFPAYQTVIGNPPGDQGTTTEDQLPSQK